MNESSINQNTLSPIRLGVAVALGACAALAGALATGALPPAMTWLLVVVMAGFIPMVLTVGKETFWPGVLLSTIVIGSAAQLALSSDIWFGTLELSLSSATAPLWAIVGAQALLTMISLGSREQRIGALALVRGLGGRRVFLLIALLALLSVSSLQLLGATWMRPLMLQAITATLLTILNLATFAAFASSLARAPRLQTKALASLGVAHARWQLLAPWVLAGVAFAASALLAVFAFQGVPHVEDEVAYLVQARTLLAGKMSLAAPPADIASSFEFYLLAMQDGEWFSVMPFGWPAALAGGVAIGPYWLLNPFLAGVAVILLYRLADLFMPRPIALACAAALALSPWHLISAGSLMAHTFSLTLQLGAWLLLAIACRKRSILLSLASGILMGALFLTRPLDGVAIGVLSGLAALIVCWRSTRGWLCLIAYGAGCIAIGALIFPYNAALTGNVLEMPLTAYFDAIWGPGANNFGFGQDIGPPGGWGGVDPLAGHSPMEALANTQHNARELNHQMFGWGGTAAFSLLPVIAHVLWGEWRRLDWLAIAFVAITVVPAALYWFSGGNYIGSRYWFMAFIPLVFLSVRGVSTLLGRISGIFTPRAVRASILPVLVFSVFSSGLYLSWSGVTRLHEFREYHADYARLSSDPALRGALVFVRSNSESEWGSALAFSGLTHPNRHAPIFALDKGLEQNARVAAYFPGRPVHYVTGRDRR